MQSSKNKLSTNASNVIESAPFRCILICITFPSCALPNRCFPSGLLGKGILQCLECSRICKRVSWHEHISGCTGTRDCTGTNIGTKLVSAYINTWTAITSIASTLTTTIATIATTATTRIDPREPEHRWRDSSISAQWPVSTHSPFMDKKRAVEWQSIIAAACVEVYRSAMICFQVRISRMVYKNEAGLLK